MTVARLLVSLVCMALCERTLAQNCQPFWAGLQSPVAIQLGREKLAVFDDGSGPALYAVGLIRTALPGSIIPSVARWNGRTWEILDAGLPAREDARPLRVLDDGQGPQLYVYVRTPGIGGEWIMFRWTGMGWVPAPNHLYSPQVGARFSFDSGAGAVMFGGAVMPNPSQVGIVQWSGASWDLIGVLSGNVANFIAYDDGGGLELYISGPFSQINGVPINGIAKWTGETWRPLGAGMYGTYHMVVHDDGAGEQLYVTGGLPGGNGLIARWNGSEWSSLPGGGIMNVGLIGLHALGSFDDGTGPALFVGGYMSMAGGGVPVRGVARWKNGVWDDMYGGTVGGIASAFAVYDDGRGRSFFVGGEFHTVGSGAFYSARNIAQWVGCQNQCYADCDNSSVAPRLNVDDFTCFINKFASGDSYADCNQDGIRNIDDFMCFINRFAEACR